MISRQDLSVIITDSLGHVSIITSNTRDALNDYGQKTKIGEKDTDYLSELSRANGQFTPQVYQAHINAKPCKSNIKTKNTIDDTIFALRHDMTIDKIFDGQVIKTAQIKEMERLV